MGNPKQIDFGGLDLIVDQIYTGATAPGQAGTDGISGNVTGDVTGSLDASAGSVALPQSVANVHDTTPTQAEMVSALGAAGRGKIATIDDADGNTNTYLCISTDASWYFLKFTKGA